MSRTRVDRLKRVRQMLVLLVAATWTGCGMAPPNAPLPTTTQPTTIDNPVIAHTPEADASDPESPKPRQARPTAAAATKNWYYVARQWVAPGTESVVKGSRYRLEFHDGSLSDGAEITIQEYSPKYLEFRLEPHGLQFGKSVDLYISYRGTNADPTSSNFDGGLPVLLWLDPETGTWEFVEGLNLKDLRTFHVRLAHFSQYAVTTRQSAGDAEW